MIATERETFETPGDVEKLLTEAMTITGSPPSSSSVAPAPEVTPNGDSTPDGPTPTLAPAPEVTPDGDGTPDGPTPTPAPPVPPQDPKATAAARARYIMRTRRIRQASTGLTLIQVALSFITGSLDAAFNP